MYEGGVRVPLIVRYPVHVNAGSESEQILSSIDLLPTLLELSGIGKPESEIDGRSFANQLRGAPANNDRTMYWHYPHYHSGSGMKPASALREGRYKLIQWHEELLTGSEEAYELFDLENDLGEQHNLKELEPEIFLGLKEKLDRWKTEVGAQMPEIK